MNAKFALLPLALLIAITTFLLWKLLPEPKPFDYGITIDAGSSHSEVILFKWWEKINGTGRAEQIANEEIATGIDDHGEDVESTVNELYTGVSKIVEKIPSEVPGPIPLFLGATAGIRILNLTKPKLVDRILESINTNLSKSIFNGGRSLKVKQVRILTGVEEGLYAWVTANYLLNNKPIDRSLLTQLIPPPGPWNQHREWFKTSLLTAAILDMGGASSQYAYQTGHPFIDDDYHVRYGNQINKVKLFGETYLINSHSNLCFGSDEVYNRYLFELIRRFVTEKDDFIPEASNTSSSSSPTSVTIPDPCNHDSPVEMRQGSEFINNPCLNTYRPFIDANLSNRVISFVPAMNHSKCASIIIDLIDQANCDLTYRVCPTSDNGPIPTGMHFYALSSYYFSTKVLPSIRNGGDQFVNDTDYLTQVSNWCSTPWSEKVQLADSKYARFLCFKQLYIFYTFRTHYQFSDDHWRYIHFLNKLSSSSLGWSLGYMLAETNVIPAKTVKPLVWPAYAFYGSIGLLVVVSLFLLAYWIESKTKSAVINQKA